MGDLHYQYTKGRCIVTTFKGGLAAPYVKLKKRTTVVRYVLLSFALALAHTFEGFAHYHPLVSALHPDSSFLLLGEGLGGTLG